MAIELHVADVGTVIRATVKDGDTAVDISAATTRKLIFRKPDGTVVEKTATNVTTGTDGQMAYTIVAGDLDQVGSWRVQGKVTIGTATWNTDTKAFRVHPNLS